MVIHDSSLSLTSQWFIKPECKTRAIAALEQLAKDVYTHEPNTLSYLIHTPFNTSPDLQSLPPAPLDLVVFFEVYRDAKAFFDHLNGAVFTNFVKDHGELFVNAHGKPFTTVTFLARRAGFIRTELPITAPQLDQQQPTAILNNQHPSVMFEIIANDQGALQNFYSTVFGWQYELGTGNFAYVHFGVKTLPLLGGIGQANPSIPGFDPGHNFYLQVDDLNKAITQAVAAGGSEYVSPTTVDGYHFAMIKDPEGNPIGLIQPFMY